MLVYSEARTDLTFTERRLQDKLRLAWLSVQGLVGAILQNRVQLNLFFFFLKSVF